MPSGMPEAAYPAMAASTAFAHAAGKLRSVRAGFPPLLLGVVLAGVVVRVAGGERLSLRDEGRCLGLIQVEIGLDEAQLTVGRRNDASTFVGRRISAADGADAQQSGDHGDSGSLLEVNHLNRTFRAIVGVSA